MNDESGETPGLVEPRRPGKSSVATVGLCILCLGFVLTSRPDGRRSSAVGKDKPKVDESAVSLEIARDRAKALHQVFETTLDSMHHHYFRRGTSIVPARAMEDIFDELALKSKVQARWIAVSLKAMGVDHEAETPFELQAVKEIAAGRGEHELVEDGYYQRAAAIPMPLGCVGCHTGLVQNPAKGPSFAGLVIRVPLKAD